MNPRTTGLLLLAALLLGAFVYVYEIREDEDGGGRAAAGDELFAGIDADDVAWIELSTTDDRAVRAEREGGGWRLTRPGTYEADSVALSGMASQLAGLDIEGRVEGDAPLEDFGLGDAAEVVRFEAAGSVYTLSMGKRTPVGSNTYVRGDPGSGIAYVSTWRTNALRKRLADLRDRRVIDFDHASVDRVEVAWPDGGVTLARSDGTWRLVRPVSEPADRATVETLLSDLAFLRADDFVEQPLSDEEAGLDAPVGRVRIAGADDEGEPFALDLAFGDVRDAHRIVRGPTGTLYLVEVERLDDIPREVLAYRDKALGDFDVADARGLALTFSTDARTRVFEARLASGRWRSVPEAVPEERVRAMVTALSRLEATAIVADAMGEAERAALGLEPPRVRVRVTGAQGEVLADVVFGLRQPDRGTLAMRADSPIVYRVDETVAHAVPTDAADFDARFVGEGDPPDDAEEPPGLEPDPADEAPDA